MLTSNSSAQECYLPDVIGSAIVFFSVLRWLPVYERWMMLAARNAPEATSPFSYDPVGSTEGKRRLANGLCSFAGTDSTLNTDEKAAMPDAWVVPSLATAIGVGFNLPNLVGNELRISREQLANIFLGRIRKWSELANENPSLANVQQSIIVVVRADASAVSAELTKALSAFSTEWKDKVGSSSKPRWPRFDLADQGDTGVALKIRTTPYSLGYVGLASAETFQVSTALIANDAGVYVAPSLDGVEAAMEAFAATVAEMVKPGEKVFALSIVDPKNSPAAYPISMFTYFAFDAARLDCGQLHAVLYLIYWGWTDPQAAEIARKQSVKTISGSVRQLLASRLREISCNGIHSLEKLLLEVTPRCPSGILLIAAQLYSIMLGPKPCLQNRTLRSKCFPHLWWYFVFWEAADIRVHSQVKF